MKSLKTLIIPFALIILTNCTNNFNGPTVDDKVKEVTSIEDVVKIAQDLEAIIPEDVLHAPINSKSYSINVESEKIEEVLEPLKNVGLNFKDELLSDSSLSKMELDNLNKLTNQELVLVGILCTVINEHAQDMIGSPKTNGTDTIQAITYDQLVGCLADAFGLTAARQLILSNAAMNADTIILAAKKLGARTLGWIGVAVFTVEFATCLKQE